MEINPPLTLGTKAAGITAANLLIVDDELPPRSRNNEQKIKMASFAVTESPFAFPDGRDAYEEIVADDGNESQAAQAADAAHAHLFALFAMDSQLRQHKLALNRRRRDERATAAIAEAWRARIDEFRAAHGAVSARDEARVQHSLREMDQLADERNAAIRAEEQNLTTPFLFFLRMLAQKKCQK